MATNNYPNDDNGDALRNMEALGDDLSKERDINFSVAFTDISSSAKFLEAAERDGLRAKQEPDSATESMWDVTVTVYMVPSHEAITQMERRLDKIASPLGGWNDGWGCFDVKS